MCGGSGNRGGRVPTVRTRFHWLLITWLTGAAASLAVYKHFTTSNLCNKVCLFHGNCIELGTVSQTSRLISCVEKKGLIRKFDVCLMADPARYLYDGAIVNSLPIFIRLGLRPHEISGSRNEYNNFGNPWLKIITKNNWLSASREKSFRSRLGTYLLIYDIRIEF